MERLLGKATPGSTISEQLEARQKQQISVIIEQTLHEMKRKNPERALAYANKGLMVDPENVTCISMKCKCYVDLHMHKEALKTADEVLSKPACSGNWIALYSKGEAMYNLCDFEHSLIFFHRSLRHCPTKEKNMIIQKISRADMAIRNVVGQGNIVHFEALREMSDSIMLGVLTFEDNLEIHRMRKRLTLGKTLKPAPTDIDEEGKKINIPKLDENTGRWRHKINRRQVMRSMKNKSDQGYLKGLIKILDDLREDPEKTPEDDMIAKANEALEFIANREVFWAQQEISNNSISKMLATELSTKTSRSSSPSKENPEGNEDLLSLPVVDNSEPGRDDTEYPNWFWFEDNSPPS